MINISEEELNRRFNLQFVDDPSQLSEEDKKIWLEVHYGRIDNEETKNE